MGNREQGCRVAATLSEFVLQMVFSTLLLSAKNLFYFIVLLMGCISLSIPPCNYQVLSYATCDRVILYLIAVGILRLTFSSDLLPQEKKSYQPERILLVTAAALQHAP